MKFEKFKLSKHDSYKVSQLIYEADIPIFNFSFGNKEKATDKIEKLVLGTDNSLSHTNIFVVTDDMNQVTGVLVANPGIKIDSFQEMRAIIRYLNIFDTFKFFIIEIIDRLFLADISPDDFYFAIIAVDPDYRGQGIGTFILENGVELAIDNNKKRVVLDVDMDNQGALRLYQRFGFVEFNKKSFSLFGWEKGAHNMEYVL